MSLLLIVTSIRCQNLPKKNCKCHVNIFVEDESSKSIQSASTSVKSGSNKPEWHDLSLPWLKINPLVKVILVVKEDSFAGRNLLKVTIPFEDIESARRSGNDDVGKGSLVVRKGDASIMITFDLIEPDRPDAANTISRRATGATAPSIRSSVETLNSARSLHHIDNTEDPETFDSLEEMLATAIRSSSERGNSFSETLLRQFESICLSQSDCQEKEEQEDEDESENDSVFEEQTNNSSEKNRSDSYHRAMIGRPQLETVSHSPTVMSPLTENFTIQIENAGSLSFLKTPEYLIVQEVTHAELKFGDRIHKINGKSVYEMQSPELALEGVVELEIERIVTINELKTRAFSSRKKSAAAEGKKRSKHRLSVSRRTQMTARTPSVVSQKVDSWSFLFFFSHRSLGTSKFTFPANQTCLVIVAETDTNLTYQQSDNPKSIPSPVSLVIIIYLGRHQRPPLV